MAFRARLTDEERKVVDLRAAGQNWAEIALALGGSADQRRVQYTRAVDRAVAELGLSSGE
jgi:hypothetical protein